MKSERRHELEKNELAQWLSRAVEKIKPYTTAIWGAVLLVAIVLLAISWWDRIALARAGSAWNSYFNRAMSGDAAPSDFDSIAAQYPQNTVGQIAALTAADIRTEQACRELFKQKPLAQQELRKAIDGYMQVLGESSVDTIQERAAFSLARANEALGDLEKARSGYEEVVKRWPKGAFGAIAQQRLESLGLMATKQFYDQFAKAETKPAAKPPTGAGPAFDYNSLAEPKGAKDSKESNASLAPPPMKIDGHSPLPPEKKATETKPAESKPAEKAAAAKSSPASSSSTPAPAPVKPATPAK